MEQERNIGDTEKIMHESKLIVRRAGFITLLCLVFAGCSSAPTLMPTPNIYLSGSFPVNPISPGQQTQDLNLLYVTDRAPESDKSGKLVYGANRSASMAWGEVDVRLGTEPLEWSELLQISSSQSTAKRPRYVMNSIEESGRFPASPYPIVVSHGMYVTEPTVNAKLDIQKQNITNTIKERLKKASLKDVVMFVHGFNNSFEDASYTLAGIWHFLERDGVPLVYSWPAAHGGVKGYFIDRESGEYTVYHLKETLRILASIPEIENIHIIAHSRGTDVTTSALRELVIESRAGGGDPAKELKIANLILAAPDLDFGVIRQRLMAEKFGPAFGQITIYTSEKDKALGFAQFLMSGLRFGRLKSTDVSHNERDIFKNVGNVSFVNVMGNNSFVGHGYFHENPAVSSDLIRLIRYKAKPGSELRPLKPLEDNFWELAPDYLE